MRPALLAAIAAAFFATAVVIVLAAGDPIGGSGESGDGGPSAERTPESKGPSLWVDESGGGCVRRSPPAEYVDGDACTLAEAYDNARSADEVWIRGGEYPQAQIGPDNDDLDEPVVMRPDEGAKVTLAGLVTYGGRLTLRDVTIATEGRHERGWISEGASDVRLDGVDITGPWANLRVQGGEGNTYANASFGTPGNTRPRVCGSGDGEPVELTLTEGHDDQQRRLPAVPARPGQSRSAARTDCCTSRRSASTTASTTSCSSAAASTAATARAPRGSSSPSSRRRARARTPTGCGSSTTGSAPPRAPRRSCSARTRSARGTSSPTTSGRAGSTTPASRTARTALTFVGNEGTQPDYLPCPGTTAAHNVWTWSAGRTDCGTDTWAIDPCNCLDGLGLAGDGFHLTAASPAVDAGQPEAECKRLTGGVDIDGEPRRGTCDAGPDELATESR